MLNEEIIKTRWLKKPELLSILGNYASHGLQPCTTVPHQPPSGSLFVYDKAVCAASAKKWRQDGHKWKDKSDRHEKLKVNGKCVITVKYAHSSSIEGLHRRAYALISDNRVLLVHYFTRRSRERKQTSPPKVYLNGNLNSATPPTNGNPGHTPVEKATYYGNFGTPATTVLSNTELGFNSQVSAFSGFPATEQNMNETVSPIRFGENKCDDLSLNIFDQGSFSPSKGPLSPFNIVKTYDSTSDALDFPLDFQFSQSNNQLSNQDVDPFFLGTHKKEKSNDTPLGSYCMSNGPANGPANDPVNATSTLQPPSTSFAPQPSTLQPQNLDAGKMSSIIAVNPPSCPISGGSTIFVCVYPPLAVASEIICMFGTVTAKTTHVMPGVFSVPAPSMPSPTRVLLFLMNVTGQSLTSAMSFEYTVSVPTMPLTSSLPMLQSPLPHQTVQSAPPHPTLTMAISSSPTLPSWSESSKNLHSQPSSSQNQSMQSTSASHRSTSHDASSEHEFVIGLLDLISSFSAKTFQFCTQPAVSMQDLCSMDNLRQAVLAVRSMDDLLQELLCSYMRKLMKMCQGSSQHEIAALCNKPDDHGRSQQHYIAALGFTRLINLLVEDMGAEIDCLDADQRTPLHYAALTGDQDMISALLSLGANADLVDATGLSPRAAMDLQHCEDILGRYDINDEEDHMTSDDASESFTKAFSDLTLMELGIKAEDVDTPGSEEMFNSAVLRIQTQIRSWFYKRHKAARRLQAATRGMLVRRNLKRMRDSAILLQSLARRQRARRDFVKLRQATLMVQSNYRKRTDMQDFEGSEPGTLLQADSMWGQGQGSNNQLDLFSNKSLL